MDKPLLLVDIDGVLNIIRGQRRPHRKTVQILDLKITMDTRAASWLADLEPHFEVWWATWWQDLARTHFAPEFGWGHEIPYIDFLKHNSNDYIGSTSMGGPKLPAVEAMVSDRPVIWVDDNGNDREIMRWATQRNKTIPTKIVVPYSDEGLTYAHCETVRNFARYVAKFYATLSTQT